MWTKAAIAEISASTVMNCFKTCGFPTILNDDACEISPESDDAGLVELVHCINPNFVGNYQEIDAALHTESFSTDILEFVPCNATQENDSDEDEEQKEEDSSLNAADAIVYIEKLKSFFLKNKKGEAFQVTSHLQMIFEKDHAKMHKKQKCITDYFIS